MGFYVPTNKDVKFPKACEQCCFYDGLLCCVLDTYIHDPENKQGECPLIEVPPHGRLIDADALINDHPRTWTTYDLQRIANAPTIIQASEEGENTDFWGEEYAEAKGLTEEDE